MTGPPEPYVPGPPSRPDPGPDETGPPGIYVPGPAADETEVAGRLRRLVEELSRAGAPAAAFPERLAAAVVRDPDLLDAVLGRLAAAMREREADAVAAPGPAGWLLAAPLADRAAVPLLALQADTGGSPAGAVPDPDADEAAGASAPGDVRRVFLVDAVLVDAGSLGPAIRRLEGRGHEVVGGVVLARAGPEEDRPDTKDHNLMSIIDL